MFCNLKSHSNNRRRTIWVLHSTVMSWRVWPMTPELISPVYGHLTADESEDGRRTGETDDKIVRDSLNLQENTKSKPIYFVAILSAEVVTYIHKYNCSFLSAATCQQRSNQRSEYHPIMVWYPARKIHTQRHCCRWKHLRNLMQVQG